MREILLNICLTAVALCLFNMLIPDTTAKKQTDFLISCFFLVSLVFFFTSGSVNIAEGLELSGFENAFDNSRIDFVDFDTAYINAQKNMIEREISDALKKALREADEEIPVQEIKVFVNISDKFSISIIEIQITLTKKGGDELDESAEDIEALKKAVQIVQKEVGIDILITGIFK